LNASVRVAAPVAKGRIEPGGIWVAVRIVIRIGRIGIVWHDEWKAEHESAVETVAVVEEERAVMDPSGESAEASTVEAAKVPGEIPAAGVSTKPTKMAVTKLPTTNVSSGSPEMPAADVTTAERAADVTATATEATSTVTHRKRNTWGSEQREEDRRQSSTTINPEEGERPMFRRKLHGVSLATRGSRIKEVRGARTRRPWLRWEHDGDQPSVSVRPIGRR